MNELVLKDNHFKDIHNEFAYKNIKTAIEYIESIPIPNIEDNIKYERDNIIQILQHQSEQILGIENSNSIKEAISIFNEFDPFHIRMWFSACTYAKEDGIIYQVDVPNLETLLSTIISFHEIIHVMGNRIGIDIPEQYTDVLSIFYERVLGSIIDEIFPDEQTSILMGKLRLLNLKESLPDFERLDEPGIDDNTKNLRIYFIKGGYSNLLSTIYGYRLFDIYKENPDYIKESLDLFWKKKITIEGLLQKCGIDLSDEKALSTMNVLSRNLNNITNEDTENQQISRL